MITKYNLKKFQLLATLLLCFGTLLNAQAIFELNIEDGSAQGTYPLGESNFSLNRCAGDYIDTMVIAYDENQDSTLFCSGEENNNIQGKFALIDRGTCNFIQKAENALADGVSGVLICNDPTDNDIVTMVGGDLGDPKLDIPVVFAADSTCVRIRMAINAGETVVAGFKYEPAVLTERTVLWGDQPGEGDFANGLNGWTVIRDSCDLGGNPFQSDENLWEHVEGLVYNKDTSLALTISSNTACNGFMLFNSAYLDHAGDLDNNQGGGECPSIQFASLVSPVIDLSGHDGKISVSYYQIAATFGSRFFIEWSEDGGDTWRFVETNTELNQNTQTEQQRVVNLWDATPTDAFRIRFTGIMDYYHWAIDDVLITSAPDNDFTVSSIAIPHSFVTPGSQVDSFLFFTELINRGSSELLNVQVQNDIVSIEENSINLVHRDSVTLDTLAFEDTTYVGTNTLFRLPDSTGLYFVRAGAIDSASADESLEDNFFEYPFFVSDDLFAKEFNVGRQSVFFTTPTTNGFRIGNVFITGITGDTYRADTAYFSLGTLFETVRGTDILIATLYEYNEDDAFGTQEIFSAQEDELTPVGTGAISVPSDYEAFELLPVRLTSVTGATNPITLKDTTSYLLALEWIPPQSKRTDTVSFAITSQSQVDYLATTNLYVRSPTMVSVGNDRTFSPFFQDGNFTVPVIRMTITDQPVDIVDDVEKTISGDLNVFPNPANDFINVELTLDQLSTNVNYTLYDLNGRVLRQLQRNNIKQHVESISVSDLNTGVYLLQISTDVGQVVKKVLVK